MPQSMIDRSQRGPSGPCHHRRRIDKQVLLARLSFDSEFNSGSVSLGFQVRNPSGKLLTAIAVGFAQIGGQGEQIQPTTNPGTWDLQPAFINEDGAPVPLAKVVDSSVANSSGNPTNLPNGWEVQTMAPLLIGNVTLDTTVYNTLAGVPEIGVYVCVSWEDVSGSFDPQEIVDIFGECGVFANAPAQKIKYT